MRQRVLRLAMCGLISFSVLGCGTDQVHTQAPEPAGLEAPEPKQPFDIILGEQLGLIEYAHQRIRNKCLADAGYPQQRDHQLARPQNPFAFLTVSARDFGPTSEDEARRKGFGHDTDGEPARVVSTDANFDAAAERCTQAAWNRIGADAMRIRTSYSDLVNALAPYRRDVDAELPADLPAKTLGCMEKSGYPMPKREEFLKTPNHRLYGITYGHVDTGPEDAWVPVRKKGTVEVGPAIPPRKYAPTPEESMLAVAWFHCGLETGRVDAQLAAVQRVQARYVEKHRTWIEELSPEIERLARQAGSIAGGS